MKKKSKTQEFFEAEIRVHHNGKIDLEKLWAKEDVEMEPSVANKYATTQES